MFRAEWPRTRSTWPRVGPGACNGPCGVLQARRPCHAGQGRTRHQQASGCPRDKPASASGRAKARLRTQNNPDDVEGKHGLRRRDTARRRARIHADTTLVRAAYMTWYLRFAALQNRRDVQQRCPTSRVFSSPGQAPLGREDVGFPAMGSPRPCVRLRDTGQSSSPVNEEPGGRQVDFPAWSNAHERALGEPSKLEGWRSAHADPDTIVQWLRRAACRSRAQQARDVHL
jgi:hypothetical protein